MKKALITGITGQDGSYLAEFLLAKGYEVHGLVRRSSTPNYWRIAHLLNASTDELSGGYSTDITPGDGRLHLHYGDLTDPLSLNGLVSQISPDEIYNLAAQSHVKVSFEMPELTADVTGSGALRVLEAARRHNTEIRFYQASSSEMFGSAPAPQNEQTPFQPRSPYGAAKLFAHSMTVNYRESYDMFAVSGILFNHESPRRGAEFVTRKITRAAAAIKAGVQDHLYLGNLDASRDWGHAADYVAAMWLMLQQDEPQDYVIGTGKDHTVRDFCEAAFSHLGLDWRDYVRHDARFERPAEVNRLLADPSKAKTGLGWKPRHSFSELVGAMVQADVQRLENLERIDPPGL